MLHVTCCVLLAAAVALTTVEGTSCSADPCSSTPCRNGGACAALSQGGYTCTCTTGFEGSSCEIAVVAAPPSPCEPCPCKNHQTCSVVNNAAVCTCPPEYTGCDCDVIRPLNCPDGFALLSGSKICVQILTKKDTWDNQKAACKALNSNSDLVVINSQAENDEISNHIKTTLSQADLATCHDYAGGYWLALQRPVEGDCKSGDLVWKSLDVCQAPPTFINYNNGEPNCGSYGVESCGQMVDTLSYKWNDFVCSSPGCAICEITLSGAI